MNQRQSLFIIFLPIIVFTSFFLMSCKEGEEVITKADEFAHVYEATEDNLIQAIAQVFKDKGFGTATINREKKEVESAYLIQDDWRTRCVARVKKINWKECEVVLSVITEKKVPNGWQMRRLLGKKQYETFLDAIELQLYQEMYKTK